MSAETAAPCRHAGSPPEAVIKATTNLIKALSEDDDYLRKHGISADEYIHALPAAIERLRGQSAAKNDNRRQFLTDLLKALLAANLISEIGYPKYAEDTIYRLSVPELGDVAIIQKGCPDGEHSSSQWTVPDWAVETYLWWLCPSTKHQPGTHIAKGVNRLKHRFFETTDGVNDRRIIDGVVFHNEMCGTSTRPCPKQARGIEIAGNLVPPPCLYVFPQPASNCEEWNWTGTRELKFPRLLLSLFGIQASETSLFTGHVGLQRKGALSRINISSGYGPGKSTTLRT